MLVTFGRILAAIVLCAACAHAAQAATPWPTRFAQIRGLLDDGKIDEAVAEGESLTTSTPNDAGAWYWYARAQGRKAMVASVFSRVGAAKASKAGYEKAVALDPNLIEARYDLMQYFVLAPGFVGGDDDRAREQAAAIAAIDPGWGHLAAGFIADKLDEDLVTAEREYLAAARLGELVAKLQLSAFYMTHERWDDARRFWTAERAAHPDDVIAGYFLGRLALEDGVDREPGLAGIDRFIAAGEFPREIPAAVAHWRRALLLEQLDRKDEARAAIAKARELLPANEGIAKDFERLNS